MILVTGFLFFWGGQYAIQLKISKHLFLLLLYMGAMLGANCYPVEEVTYACSFACKIIPHGVWGINGEFTESPA